MKKLIFSNVPVHSNQAVREIKLLIKSEKQNKKKRNKECGHT